jgi:hypothetical protein
MTKGSTYPHNAVTICHPSPVDKRKYIRDIGQILVKKYGKKKYYKPRQVKEAHKQSPWYDGVDFSCWGMSTYSSHLDFDLHHEKTGEVCDYAEMKSTMLEGISQSEDVHLSDLPQINMDVSWLDFGIAFDGILEGVGEFFSSIADGVDL